MLRKGDFWWSEFPYTMPYSVSEPTAIMVSWEYAIFFQSFSTNDMKIELREYHTVQRESATVICSSEPFLKLKRL